MFATFTETILRRRAATLLALTLLVGAVVGGIARLGADFSVESFFGKDDPETAYLVEYQERWGDADLLMIVADGGDAGLLARDRLQQLDELAQRLEELEGIGRVMSVTRVMRGQRGPVGSFVPVPLLATAPRAEADDPRVEAWRQSVLADPQVVPTYLSEDGRYGTILLALDVPTNDLARIAPVVRRVEAVLEQTEAHGFELYLGGVPAIRADVLSVIVRDQFVAVPVAGGLMGLLLLLLFRSKHGLLIPMIAAGVPTLMLLGVMGWTGEPFGLLNQVFLALVPAIAVADAVHLLARFHEEARKETQDGRPRTSEGRDRAIVRTMAVMGVACFLTSFTTVIGFLSLTSTDMPVLANFGLYAGVGVALAYFTVLFIVPIALLWTKSEARRVSHGTEGPLGGLLAACVYLATRRAPFVVAGAFALTAAAVAAGTLVVTDWKVTESFDEEHPVSIANTLVDRHLGGVLALEFDLAGPPGAFSDPEVLRRLADVEEAAREVPGVRTTVGPASIVRTTSTLVAGRDRLPEDAALAERLYGIGDQAGLVSSFVSADRDRARLLVRSADVGAVRFLEVGEQLQGTLTDALGAHGVTAHLTGSTYVSSRGISTVTRDLRNSLLSAFGIIGVIIAVLFRSVRFGLLSLVPNALPLLVGYGAMGLLGWELEPARAVVFTIAIGISVDSAIHVLARFREEREAGLGVEEAVESAILHSGRAITITTLMLIVGFAANINSSAPANAAFGRLGTIIIAAALLANLLVLPALLQVGSRRGPVGRTASTAAPAEDEAARVVAR